MKHNSVRSRLALIVFGAMFAASMSAMSSTASAAMAGSCNNPAGGMCIEYNGPGYRDAQKLQRTCEALKSTFIVGAGCPAAGLVGTCVRYKGDALESNYRYYTQFPGSGITYTREKVATEGQRQCKPPKGAWTSN